MWVLRLAVIWRPAAMSRRVSRLRNKSARAPRALVESYALARPLPPTNAMGQAVLGFEAAFSRLSANERELKQIWVSGPRGDGV